MDTTIYLSPEDEIDVELKTKITEICTPGQKKYPKSTRQLNYEAINKNYSIARIGRKPDVPNYDYKVGNHVEFSKLFMRTCIAQYTAFDGTCDLSAHCLIVSIDTFPQQVQKVAIKLRSDVRNPWAHCNFDEWDSIKYQTSFQLMHQLIKCLNLNKPDETNVLSELTKWETNGFLFLQGYSVDQTVVTDLPQQTQILTEYALKMKACQDSSFIKVHEAMSIINGDIASVLEKLADEVKATTEDVSYIKRDFSEMKENVGNFKNYMSQSKPTGTIFFYPPNRSEYFVTREKEMNQIQIRFVDKDNENQTLVLSGLGGCGKTTLANEFAWKSQNFIRQVYFRCQPNLQVLWRIPLQHLLLMLTQQGRENFRETFKRTLNWFSNLNERWLLVVDNADEEYLSDNTKKLLVGSWKRHTCGYVLITTRQIKTKLKKFGGLPSALEQATTHIKSIKCSFADYVRRFEKKRLHLLKAAPSPRKISKDRLAVAITWQLNIEYISRESENEGLGTAAIAIMEIFFFVCR
ncbi:unnamed protein product [Mytilus coruscus]|uniref:NB-ARC domain-containing protein n=1 Tax=Mytilus coruscus TaxID=42192 RepID=A0A6J8E6R7_MYTCO|nr:unnamed protein product [Mytilus coruscus]